jgi:hypothetical protein
LAALVTVQEEEPRTSDQVAKISDVGVGCNGRAILGDPNVDGAIVKISLS